MLRQYNMFGHQCTCTSTCMFLLSDITRTTQQFHLRHIILSHGTYSYVHVYVHFSHILHTVRTCIILPMYMCTSKCIQHMHTSTCTCISVRQHQSISLPPPLSVFCMDTLMTMPVSSEEYIQSTRLESGGPSRCRGCQVRHHLHWSAL